ncbi:Gfo/Idh/MocA family oxidoreductase [Georgenia sp. MJ206]|uniref:Gfo/Idh/MocA family oxidoreductase n=1 Tax=Georgenia wangjunii TaxID=3117730 RepID=UPI002F26C7FC
MLATKGTTMTAPLRTALVGFGHAGQVFHAPLLADDPAYSLDVIVTADPGRTAIANARYPGARVVPSATDLRGLAGDLDLVVVATPPSTHLEVAHAALDDGLAVVVDKPLCASAADAEVLVARAERLGVPLTVFHNRRWDAEFLTLRGLLADGALGEVFRFESRIDRWKTAETKPWKAAATTAEAGGVLYDLGTHLIDQAITLFGPVVDVHAEIDVRRPHAGTDDDVFVALTHANGVRSHISAGNVAAQAGPRMRVLGSRAAFVKQVGDGQEAALTAGAVPSDTGYGVEPASTWGTLGVGEDAEPVPTERGSYDAFYAELARALREDGPLPVDPRDAVAVIALIEGIHRTAGRA